MKEMRRAPIVILFVGIIFVTVQLSAVVNTDDPEERTAPEENNQLLYSIHDEMVDRPMSLELAQNALRLKKKGIRYTTPVGSGSGGGISGGMNNMMRGVDGTRRQMNVVKQQLRAPENNRIGGGGVGSSSSYTGPVDAFRPNQRQAASGGTTTTRRQQQRRDSDYSGPVDAFRPPSTTRTRTTPAKKSLSSTPGVVDPIVRDATNVYDSILQPAAERKRQKMQQQQHSQLHPPPRVTLPASFNNYIDVDIQPVTKKSDVPFFWYIPMSGATTFKQILGKCLGMTLPAEPGSQYEVTQTVETFSLDDVKYANVDTTNPTGIQRAQSLHLLPSNLISLVISPYLYESTALFSHPYRGRMFTVMRHPMERAAAQYEYLKTVNEQVAKMTLKEYGMSSLVENNWMTRFLANKLAGEITGEHLMLAKEVLRRKCLVGLFDNMWASLKRFESYFGWQYVTNPQRQYECRKQMLIANLDKTQYPVDQNGVKEGTNEWTVLSWQNKFDLELYDYAKELFRQQMSMFPEMNVIQN